MIRSILAVIAGIAALTITSFAIEAVANPILLRIFPETLPDEAAINRNVPASLFLFTYMTLCVVFGGYVTAWIARRSPVRHALIMGAVQLGLNVMAYFSFTDLAPLQIWIISALLVVPAAWFGGVLRARQEKPAELRPA